MLAARQTHKLAATSFPGARVQQISAKKDTTKFYHTERFPNLPSFVLLFDYTDI